MGCHCQVLSHRWSIAYKIPRFFSLRQCLSRNQSMQNPFWFLFALHLDAQTRFLFRKWIQVRCPTTNDCFCSSQIVKQTLLRSRSEDPTRLASRFAWIDRCMSPLSSLQVSWSADNKPRSLQQWRYQLLDGGCFHSDLLPWHTPGTRSEEVVARRSPICPSP